MRVLVLLAASARIAAADDSALPCRPTIACTADIVHAGTAEVEAGYIYRRLAHGVNQSSTPFLIKLSLTDWIQVQLGSNGMTYAGGDTFFDDIEVGLKARVLRQSDHVPAVSISALASVPTFAATGYQRTYDLLATLYVTKDVSWLHTDFNVGYSAWRLEGSPLSQAWTALAFSVPLDHHVGAMLEGYLFSDAAPLQPPDAGVLAAVSYQPRPWLVLDAGPDVALEHATRILSAFVGMTIIPVELW